MWYRQRKCLGVDTFPVWQAKKLIIQGRRSKELNIRIMALIIHWSSNCETEANFYLNHLQNWGFMCSKIKETPYFKANYNPFESSNCCSKVKITVIRQLMSIQALKFEKKLIMISSCHWPGKHTQYKHTNGARCICFCGLHANSLAEAAAKRRVGKWPKRRAHPVLQGGWFKKKSYHKLRSWARKH